jgi:predicted nucleotidyltransferase
MSGLAMQEEVEKILRAVLQTHLTKGEQVYVFGSRARGAARAYSDLDIAIDGQGRKLDFSTECALKGDLEESDIPYRVDIIDLNAVSPQFKQSIQADLVPLQYAPD